MSTGLTTCFEQFTTNKPQPEWLQAYRLKQREQFLQCGLPTKKNEWWKYTNVAYLDKATFSFPSLPSVIQAPLKKCHQQAISLVFNNGHFSKEMSDMHLLPATVILMPLSEALDKHEELIKPYLLNEKSSKQHPFMHFNAAIMKEGVFLYVPDNCIVPYPIHLVYLQTEQQHFISSPHNIIVAGASSQVKLIEEYSAQQAENYFTNTVTKLYAHANASMEYYKLQNEHFTATHLAMIHVQQKQDSKVTLFFADYGSKLAREDVAVNLHERGATCDLHGVYLLERDEQHIDNHIFVDHLAAHCTSSMLYKGILDKKSQAVFNGKVYAHTGAKQTNAQQANHNLILSTEAEVNTKPELEIYEEDVKCAHGATVGYLNADLLFYLRARGIEKNEALKILAQAFVEEVMQKIEDPTIKNYFQQQMGKYAHLKNDFPIFNQTPQDRPLIYSDSSSTSQKPACVISAVAHYYQHDNANVHRGIYELSERATRLYEKTRKKVQWFINAAHAHEVIFTRGTTESINLVAQSYGRSQFKAGDEIILSEMEHHSNIVPWQLLQQQVGIKLKIIPVTDAGELDLEAYQKLFSPLTKMVAITHVSNVLGTVNPLKKIIAVAHAEKVPVLVDGAAAFPHMSVDMQALDCDFYAFSAHKAYGPTGVGVLYGKTALLEKMSPYQGGGSMIERVTFEKTTYAPLPYRFEAGTPAISSVVGFYSALEYLEKIGMPDIMQHEQSLLSYATSKLTLIPELTIIGNAENKAGVLSFVLNNVHPHDIATILDNEGIAVRAGHHCAMPLMERYQIPACVRASFGLYNTTEDVDALLRGMEKVYEVFQ